MKLNIQPHSKGEESNGGNRNRGCPVCEREGEYLPIQDEHWFACHADNVCWCVEKPSVTLGRTPSRKQSHQNWLRLLGYCVSRPTKHTDEFPDMVRLFEEVVCPPKAKQSHGESGSRAAPRVYTQSITPLFGCCPSCGRMTGYVNIGTGSWFFCQDHQRCWFAGERRMMTFLDENRSIWQANHEFLRGFRIVADNGGLMRGQESRPGPYFEHVAPTVETLLEPVSMLPSTPPSLGIWESVDRTLAYFWDQERRHYVWSPQPGHIFCDLWRLRHALRRLRDNG